MIAAGLALLSLGFAQSTPSDVRPPPEPVRIRPTPPTISLSDRAAALRAFHDQQLILITDNPTQSPCGLPWFAPCPGQPFVTVSQGGNTLDVPHLLDVLGQQPRARRVRQQIRFNRGLASLCRGVAVVGAAALVSGVVESSRTFGEPRSETWERVALAGVGLGLGGLGLSLVPARRADRLRYDVGQSYPFHALVNDTKEYNEALAEEVGLDF